jgi:tRNA-Thr(GGU) m(6)t(6)A37 methyltransferase TsaA
MNEPITLVPIGVVHNDVAEPDGISWEEVVSRIEVAPELVPALAGIEAFSHLVVIFAFHRRPAGPPPLQVHPERRAELPLVGVFATRSPRRPNPIAVTVVELLERTGNVLTVRGLDALDGTPVLDLKPYLPQEGLIGQVRIPAWLKQLQEMRNREKKRDTDDADEHRFSAFSS